MAKTSPTQRGLALLRKEGYSQVAIVEKFNQFSKTRHDLFNCIDILAINPGVILGVQVTSGSNHSKRVNKALLLESCKDWLKAGGRFEVWSFSKKVKSGKVKRWEVRKRRFTLEDFNDVQSKD